MASNPRYGAPEPEQRAPRRTADMTGTKRPTNISLDAGLVAAAKELGINVSQACETGLAAQVSEARNAEWIKENWEAIQSWNAYVEDHGLPLAHLRPW